MNDLEVKEIMTAIEKSGLSVAEAINVINYHKKLNFYEDFELAVDYDQRFSELISGCDYDYVGDDVAEKHFPTPLDLVGKQLVVSARLFDFSPRNNNPCASIDSKEVVANMLKDGYRPAIPIELLSLVATYPTLQREFPIAALGSPWRRFLTSYVVHVYNFNKRSNLETRRLSDNWYPGCRFLGIRQD